MSFLKSFRIFFRSILLRKECLPNTVLPSEQISRFILDPRHMKNGLKAAAFIPKEDRLSVYRTVGYTEKKIWDVAYKYVTSLRADGKAVLARADIGAVSFTDVGLAFDANGEPHPRHADVINWPADKAEKKQKALELIQKLPKLIPIANVETN